MVEVSTKTLTDKQSRFVRLIADGSPIGQAASAAGYKHPETCGSRLLRVPAVGQAVNETIKRRILTVGASLGFNVLKRLAESANGENVQFQAAKTLIQAAGHLADKGKRFEGSEKQEITLEDLETMQQMIAARKAKLEDQIKDITPDNAQINADIEVFPLTG